MNDCGEKFCEQYIVKQIVKKGTRHDEFKEILLKFEFRVRDQVPFSISLKS